MRLAGKLRTCNGAMPRAPQPSGASAGSLVQVIADLNQLNRDTEQDFLRIGGKLAEFMQTVSLISSELTTLANTEHGHAASLALAHALDRSTEMKAALGDSDGDLADMHKEIVQMKRTLSGFEATVSTFHTLALLTRIETARLGSAGAGFSLVADDVSSLAGQVQSKVEGALAIADSLIPPIEAAMRKISTLETRQARDLPVLISRTLASLSSFGDVQDKAQQSSLRLGSQYGAISESFKKLIVSIQFHDITRQQVEHVIEVLERLCSEPGGADGGASRHPRGTSAVLALQSAQLADAGEKFRASVASVESNLEGIARHVLEMAHDSRAIAGLSEGENGSFFMPMERDCGAILTSLGQTEAADAATRAARKSLQETVGQMRQPIQEIRQIELRMRRVALNARISAFQLGSAGSALNALAGSVQQLASQCRSQSELLSSMSLAASRSRFEDKPDQTGEPRNGHGATGDLRLAVGDLHSSVERSFAMILQIVTRGDGLASDLAATREGFSVGSLFAESVKRVRGSIEEIARNAQSGWPHDDGDEPEPGLADFLSHYSMQAERDVHEGVTGGVSGTPPISLPAESRNSPPGEADELGDNVEFF